MGRSAWAEPAVIEFIGQRLLLPVLLVLFSWLYSRIVARAGFSGWWALLSILPLVNFVMLWVFAFKDWPAIGESEPKPNP